MNKILIVEDDSAITVSLSEFLTGEGFSVRTAPGQTDAVEIINTDRPDLILVDISLRDGNGFSVCAYAKQQNLAVVFLTASGDELSVVTGLIWAPTITFQSRSARVSLYRAYGA